MRIFVVLHVLSMFAAVAVTGGGDLLFYRIARSRDAAAIRTAGAVFGRLARVIPALFGLGAVFGIVAIFVHRSTRSRRGWCSPTSSSSSASSWGTW